eukprot:scaffold37820_cov36-Cyclotella_meneghiniana.AAC.2
MSKYKQVTTLAGKLRSEEVVTTRDIRLPEFDKNRRIDQHTCLVFDNDKCNYDIILGTKFLSKVGIKLNYEDEQMEWFDTTLPLKPVGGLTSQDFDAMVNAFHVQMEDEFFGVDWLQNFATAMLDAKYEYVSVRQVIDNDIEDIEVYIDDIGAFSMNWDEHVKVIGATLQRLHENGFTINPLECEWAVKETDWLGYWLTPRGLKPWRKKIDAILHMDRPRTPKELRRFIGCVNYYRDMWPSRAHILKPLNDQAGLKKGEKLNWTDDMQQ